MSLITVIFLAISLSMDAFSLSLAYGTLNINNKLVLSIIVGIFHFFMPIIGNLVGYKIIRLIPINTSYIVFMILFFIGFEMIIESFKENNNVKYLYLNDMLLFGFAVSLDSFTAGIGLDFIYKYKFVSITLFSIFSFIFTYLGLSLGNYLNKIIGKYATIIGGISLIIIGLIYII